MVNKERLVNAWRITITLLFVAILLNGAGYGGDYPSIVEVINGLIGEDVRVNSLGVGVAANGVAGEALFDKSILLDDAGETANNATYPRLVNSGGAVFLRAPGAGGGTFAAGFLQAATVSALTTLKAEAIEDNASGPPTLTYGAIIGSEAASISATGATKVNSLGVGVEAPSSGIEVGASSGGIVLGNAGEVDNDPANPRIINNGGVVYFRRAGSGGATVGMGVCQASEVQASDIQTAADGPPTLTYGAEFAEVATAGTDNASASQGRIAFNSTVFYFRDDAGAADFTGATGFANTFDCNRLEADFVTDRSNTGPPTATYGMVFTPMAEPGSPVEGQVYMDSTSHKLRVYNGSSWDNLN